MVNFLGRIWHGNLEANTMTIEYALTRVEIVGGYGMREFTLLVRPDHER